MKVLSYSKGIINSNYNNIVFICNIREDLYFRCILFENSQFYVLINFNSYEETDILKGIINLVNLIIKNIKKYSSIKTLNILQINHLFDIKQVNISNNFLEDCTLKFEYILNDNLDTSNLFNKLSDKVSTFKNYFSFISNPLKPNLKFLFKGINPRP